jgi:hypothetical protein
MSTSDNACLTLAAYGFDLGHSPIDHLVSHFWTLLHGLLQDIHIETKSARASIQGKRIALTSGSFLEADTILRGGRLDRIDSIQVMVSLTEYLGTDPCQLTAGFSKTQQYAIISTPTLIIPGRTPEVLSLCARVCRALSPCYGIAYMSPTTNQAVYYALGISYGTALPKSDDEWEEEERISRWGHTGMPSRVYGRGLLRGVYPWNILSQQHTEMHIDGQSLESWIKSLPDRGRLYQLTSLLRLWEVPFDRLLTIRSLLSSAGLLFS